MRLLNRTALAVLIAGLAMGGAAADGPHGYLAKDALDAVAVVGPPPAAGSAAEAADVTAYRSAAAGVDTPRWREALADDDIKTTAVMKRYACALDAEVGPDTAPALARLLERTLRDAGEISEVAKTTYRRPRPFAADDPSAPVCLDIPAERRASSSFTYPSGHATVGWLWGLVLAEAAPARATQVMARSRVFTESRQVCRVHYPTDVLAGERLGAAIYARLQSSPEYEADVKAARAEIAAAPRPSGCG